MFTATRVKIKTGEKMLQNIKKTIKNFNILKEAEEINNLIDNINNIVAKKIYFFEVLLKEYSIIYFSQKKNEQIKSNLQSLLRWVILFLKQIKKDVNA